MKIKVPYPSQPRDENIKYGNHLVDRFFQINSNIRRPYIDLAYARGKGYFGYCTSGRRKIVVYINRCKLPVKTPGFSWSYTGYKADLTPTGVLCHELGHAVDANYCYDMKKFVRGENRVSSYEPNSAELFAEAFKVFMTNPELLKAGRPLRYRYFVEVLKLIPPLETSPWEEVLCHAHPKLINAAKNWIKS